MLTREETLLLAPVIGAWILWYFRGRSWGTRSIWAAAYIGGAALVLVPVAARNAYVGGEFVLTTSQAGSNFYIGNHHGALSEKCHQARWSRPSSGNHRRRSRR